MPTYEYECLKCKKTFEEFQSIKAKAIQNCPFCLGEVKRIISKGAHFIFKGNGFYITDYRSEEYKKKKKEEVKEVKEVKKEDKKEDKKEIK